MKEEIRLKILDEFHCLAEKCSASCCNTGFVISVDDETYNKWKSVDNKELKDSLLSQLIVLSGDDKDNPDIQTNTDTAKYSVAVRPGGSCVHLTNEGLCSLQVRFGHDFIPQVCREFPRKSRHSKLRGIKSMTFGCPETIRLAVLEGCTDDLFVWDNRQHNYELPADRITVDDIIRRFDRFTWEVFDQREYNINLRLYLVGTHFRQLLDKIKKKEFNPFDFNEQCMNYRQLLADIAEPVNTVRYAVDVAAADRFWATVWELARERQLLSGFRPDNDVLIGVKDSAGQCYSALKPIMEQHRPDLRRHANELERYSIISLVNRGFPWMATEDNESAQFAHFIIMYGMIHMLCWAHLLEHGTLAKTDLADIILNIERHIGSSTYLYSYILSNKWTLNIDKYSGVILDF